MQVIPYGHQQISEADIEAVVHVLRSEYITQGPAIPRFEAALTAYCGAAHAIAVSSATAGLHLACLALDLRPGDGLWTVPNTFVASANCGRYCGARVDFVDIDPVTWNMNPAALERKLVAAAASASLPKIIVPVHFGGLPCDMAAISAIARRYGVRVIEDAAHAIGGAYETGKIGSGCYADITVFSFHPVKIVTTAEGGACLTNDAELAEKMRVLRSHGISLEPTAMTGPIDGPWYYEQQELGYNYRLTDLQAALGTNQMERIDQFVARRHLLAERYERAFAGLPMQLPVRSSKGRSALHLYVIRSRHPRKSRGQLFVALRAAGIGVNVHYIPVHLQPYYRRMGFGAGDFPESERHYAEAITLPLFPALTEDEQARVISAVGEAWGDE